MASGRYSFIDIAVLEKIRGRFAAGEALVLLSADLEHVVWANGAGAALLGYRDVETVMGAPADLGFVARRQIAAAPGFPNMARDHAVLVRLARGVSSRAERFEIGALTLPDGVPAVLIAAPEGGDARDGIVAGFEEAGYLAALLGEGGSVLAASESFAGLELAPATLAGLTAEAARESDRLVKRLAPAGHKVVPVGVARLTDDPTLYLLIGVDEEGAEDGETETAEAQAPVGAAPDADLPAPSDADLPDRLGEKAAAAAPLRPAEPAGHGDADHWYFDGPHGSADERRDALPRREGGANLAAGSVRFVWRTDATGAFSVISPEFAAAVGADAADVIGQSFGEAASRLGIDADGELASLLERRDTWSGRTVLWPVSGTDLAAPVDLAALPAYDRDRVFEGFRGFGIVRMDEAVTDPLARGLSLGREPEPEPSAEVEPPVADSADEAPPSTPADPFMNEVPVISITDRLKRRVSDKIIRLAEHRPPQPESQQPPQPAGRQLSPGERSAFEEIRARLRRETAPAQEEAGKGTGEPAQTAAPAEEPVATPPPEPETPPESGERDAPAAQTPPPEPESAAEGEAPHEPEAAPPALATADGRPGVDPELIAGLPLPLLVHAGDALYFANDEFFDLTGYASLDELREAGGLDRLFADHEQGENGGEAEAGAGHPRALLLRRRDGDIVAIDAHLQSIGWEGGAALLLALRRVTPVDDASAPAPDPAETQELERRLAELRTIIDTATDGVVLIAPGGTIRNISRPAEALFGIDSARVEGQPFTSLFAIESRKSAADYLAGLADNGVASVLNDGREVIGREAEGRFIPLFMTIGKLPEDSGYCAVVRDITHFKRAEEDLTQARAQAERASSQKTEFLARISHEIRTPLNAIIGFSELMMDEKFGPIGSDRYRDYLRDINRSGNHVLDLVNDLLDISKIEAGEQEMNYEAVSLNEALSEAIAMMQPQANRERVIIRSSLASRLPEVVADLRSVRQIALNLLSNAIRYNQAGGQVIVSTAYEASGDVAMRVRDTGIGMTLAEIDQALKPFRQINALKRGRHDGTGLGLPLTKAMVEANRARFAINSTPGEGTLVEIVFPSTRVLAE
jgi:PAS domain S-box-containing protein